jgi:hypothetical protein
MAEVKYELMACTDCLMLVANGDHPEENTEKQDAEMDRAIEANLGDDQGYLCCGDSDKDEEFSWSACECCGSKLGGSRHHLVVVR